MASHHLSEAIQQVRKTLIQEDQSGLTDGQLLECFISNKENSALEGLVRRYSPMVWSVCRRILHNHHDAEDAFQATFLVLMRKATSIIPREMLANWLYGVAHQTALNAKAATDKKKQRERQVIDMPEPVVAKQSMCIDLQCLLDQELSRLPDKYRVVILLCDLEGKTRKEVARQLGLAEGTVASRLARAREMLAKRLSRRGLTVSSGALAVALTDKAMSMSVPASVLSSTIKAGMLVASGQAVTTSAISARVITLTEGVLKTMLLNKLKIVAGTLFVMLVMVGVGSGMVAHFTATDPPTKNEESSAESKNKETIPLKKIAIPVTDNSEVRVQPKKDVNERKPGEPELSYVQIRIAGVAGMKVIIQNTKGKFEKSSTIETPCRINLEPGKSYRLKLSDIPNHPGLELYPTIWLTNRDQNTEAFLNSATISFDFTQADFDKVRQNKVVTKVVYLSAESMDTMQTKVSYEVKGGDPVTEAQSQGFILAILRIGNIDLESSH